VGYEQHETPDAKTFALGERSMPAHFTFTLATLRRIILFSSVSCLILGLILPVHEKGSARVQSRLGHSSPSFR
jgi:hypothetical protein